jgi:hypothetical protein
MFWQHPEVSISFPVIVVIDVLLPEVNLFNSFTLCNYITNYLFTFTA